MEKHLLAIPNRCTGCNRCTYACAAVKEGMFMPSKARVKINNFPLRGYSVPSVCFQCPKPDCLEACPEEAIFKNERGIVAINAPKCNGCGDCVYVAATRHVCPNAILERWCLNNQIKLPANNAVPR
jgi:Fe-S-cluster-containing dehydrogenase component